MVRDPADVRVPPTFRQARPNGSVIQFGWVELDGPVDGVPLTGRAVLYMCEVDGEPRGLSIGHRVQER